MRDVLLEELVRRALVQLDTALAEYAPLCRARLERWFPLAFARDPAVFWMKPTGFPLLQLPSWFAQSQCLSLDEEFLSSTISSSLSGYLYIRLIDKAMDGDADADLTLLPAAAVLHAFFQRPYQDSFPADHPFWHVFLTTWGEAADLTLQDRALDVVTIAQFDATSSRKFAAAMIPIAAAAFRLGRTAHLHEWVTFVDRLGRWYQLNNDFFDWRRDQANGVRTFVLSEADRRRAPGESITTWFLREGIESWAQTLTREMEDLRAAGARIGSPALTAYLTMRASALHERLESTLAGAKVLRSIATAFAL
jgi:hypothetical protein